MFILQSNPIKGIYKNVREAWNLKKRKKLRHESFDNNLEKIFQTNILKNVFLIVALMVGLRLGK